MKQAVARSRKCSVRGIASVALKPLFKQRLGWRLAGPGSFAQEIPWHPHLANGHLPTSLHPYVRISSYKTVLSDPMGNCAASFWST